MEEEYGEAESLDEEGEKGRVGRGGSIFRIVSAGGRAKKRSLCVTLPSLLHQMLLILSIQPLWITHPL